MFNPLFVYDHRAHIPRHGTIPLWAKWAGSAGRVAVWTSGCPSSTSPNDELLTAKRRPCERTFICTGWVVWTLMDTWPSRDQIPKHCWVGQGKFGGGKSTLLSTRDVFRRENKKRALGGWFVHRDGAVSSCVCQLGGQQGWDGTSWGCL